MSTRFCGEVKFPYHKVTVSRISLYCHTRIFFHVEGILSSRIRKHPEEIRYGHLESFHIFPILACFISKSCRRFPVIFFAACNASYIFQEAWVILFINYS